MILVGMEESGVIREALRAKGLPAWSCDLQPARDNSPFHIQDDIRIVARSRTWKRAIIHPVCQYLSQSGVQHLYINPGKGEELIPDNDRWVSCESAADFFLDMLSLPYPVVCENPRMHWYGLYLIGHPFCDTQPYLHGDKAMKGTHFWRNHDSFAPLKPSNPLRVPLPYTLERKEWEAVWREPPGPLRQRNRSRSFPGLAKAIADQWFS